MVSVLFYGVYVDVCGGHTATFTVIPQELPILFLETGSLAGVESVKKSRLAGQGTPGIHLLHHLGTGLKACTTTCLAFCMWVLETELRSPCFQGKSFTNLLQAFEKEK